jgi:Sec63 Brl domain
MIDVAADTGLLTTSLTVMNMLQCIKQARYVHDSTLLTLPGIQEYMLDKIKHKGRVIRNIAELTEFSPADLQKIFQNLQLSKDQIRAVSCINVASCERFSILISWTYYKITAMVSRLPVLNIQTKVDTQKSYLIPEAEYKIKIEIRRLPRAKGPHNGRIHSPFFPKPQYESWWLVLGDTQTDELLALKRISMRNGPNETLGEKANTSLTIDAPARLGKHEYTLFVMSDGYLGLDQIVTVPFETRMDLDS